MTNEQLKQNATAMLAFADGKPIEYKSNGVWVTCTLPIWTFREHDYRPKPEPKVRPWSGPSDVPFAPSIWLMLKTDLQNDFVTQILTVGETGIRCTSERGTVAFYTWSALSAMSAKHSTDRREWAKCTVTEP